MANSSRTRKSNLKNLRRTDRITFILPKRGWAKVEFENSTQCYFSNMFVANHHRESKICQELVKFAIQYLNIAPEIDVTSTSDPAKACIRKVGYKKVGPSVRYLRCELWRSNKKLTQFSKSRLELITAVRYERSDGCSEVVYTRDNV